jgi:hypothetical protein
MPLVAARLHRCVSRHLFDATCTVRVFGPPKTRSGAADQAGDSVPFPPGVSAFPTGEKGTESPAIDRWLWLVMLLPN